MIYIVGDSTVSEFNEVYYYHRYGWGTMLYNYFKEGTIFLNLALSGRSSLSFIKEDNYKELLNITKGDYLFIGFGHNDEKDDDPNRYTNPYGSIRDSGSFKNILYNYYIKVALEKGATPILCTPIARLDENNIYDGKHIHITRNGDYRKCIIDLANELNISCVDLTTYSKELNQNDGYEESCLRHAITKGKLVDGKLVPDIGTVDQTHINIYGAKTYAYFIAKTLKESNNPIKELIKDNLVAPSKEKDLIMDEDYVYIPYKAPEFSDYNAPDWFKTNDKNYVGIAFGDTGRGTLDQSNGYIAYEDNNKFVVGQKLVQGTKSTPLGKISLNSEGISLIARKIRSNINFTFTCKANVTYTEGLKLSGFGVSLRDDLYLDLRIPDKTINSNYVASSLVMGNDKLHINSKRENGLLNLENNVLDNCYKVNDQVCFKVVRLGQVVEVYTTYLNKTYKNTYTDFDFTKVDKDYFYITLYATRSTVVEFSDLNFVENGISQGA